MIQLPVPDGVLPRPREDGGAGGGVGGDSEVVVGREGAAADDGLDDGESGAAVVAEGGLARATTVGGAAGDGHVVGAAWGEGGGRGAGGGADVLVVALARVVGAVAAEGRCHRVVDVAAGVGVELGPEGGRVGELHVSGGEVAGGQEGYQNRGEGRHLGGLRRCEGGW